MKKLHWTDSEFDRTYFSLDQLSYPKSQGPLQARARKDTGVSKYGKKNADFPPINRNYFRKDRRIVIMEDKIAYGLLIGTNVDDLE